MRNTFLSFMLAFAIMLVPGCRLQTITVEGLIEGAQTPSAPRATIHCDTSYTPEERAAIQRAADLWSKQTSGRGVITLFWDVDFGSTQDIVQHVAQGHHIMLRLESWMDIVTAEDSPDGLLMGIVSPSAGIHNPWGRPLKVGFVVDRMDGMDQLTQVSLHEFGHVLGLPHTADVHGIMFPAVIDAPAICLKHSDLASFCDINDCGDSRMLPCE